MAISTQGTVLKIKLSETSTKEVAIKSFPDLGAVPNAIDVTTLKDDVQKFIPGTKALAAMEFVANYDKADFTALKEAEGSTLEYTVEFGENGAGGKFSFTGTHAVTVAGAGVNAAVDMKITILPDSEITAE